MAIQAKNFNKVNKFTINVQNFLLANTTLIDAKMNFSLFWVKNTDTIERQCNIIFHVMIK